MSTRNSTNQTLPAHFSFSRSDPDHTGLLLVALHDQRTNFTVRTALSQEDKQVPAIMAFAGARFSRSALTAEELFAEITGSQKSAQEKLANIFVNYGHSSVGDMANLFAYIENVPRYLLMQFFYATALGGGQERSSRYQNFAQAQPPHWSAFWPTELSESDRQQFQREAHDLFMILIKNYEHFLPQITAAFTTIYQPEPDNKAQLNALQARAFDTVRAFLPGGTNTSGAYITSAREWARLMQYFRSIHDPLATCLAEQLEILFAPPATITAQYGYLPEAPDLIRYTAADKRTDEALQALAILAEPLITRYTRHHGKPRRQTQRVKLVNLAPEEKYLYFSLLRFVPRLNTKSFKEWLINLSPYTRKKISQILFATYDHHHHLPNYASTGGYTFELNMSLSESIDFNRHRAWGRFTPFLETGSTSQLIGQGFYLPAYLDHPQLGDLRGAFTQALSDYYEKLQRFADRLPPGTHPRLLLTLLPNAHALRYFMTAGPKEISYLTHLRVRPGGHINYRLVAYDLAQRANQISPLMSGLRLPESQRPDPFDRAQFFDRG